eukprot:GHVR01177249.1.p2 GENE.GHVR01177249.1~~GHVR01177249.1.p2  ORF type:complete len:103 (+),score=29.70 GHVR01177249.1:313-621(+)
MLRAPSDEWMLRAPSDELCVLPSNSHSYSQYLLLYEFRISQTPTCVGLRDRKSFCSLRISDNECLLRVCVRYVCVCVCVCVCYFDVHMRVNNLLCVLIFLTT